MATALAGCVTAAATIPVVSIAGSRNRDARALQAKIGTAFGGDDDPEIIRLQAEMKAAFVEYQRTMDARIAVLTEWSPQWPVAPKEIRTPVNREMERSLDGWAIKDEDDQRVYVHTAKQLRDLLEVKKGKWGEKALRRRPAIAESFEREKARVTELSGYESVNNEHWAVAKRLKSIIEAILERPGEDLQDNVLRARALIVSSRMEYIHQIGLKDAYLWAPKMAELFLAHVAKGS